MTLLETCINACGTWPAATVDGSRVRITTHCLYPSNAAVNVYIEGRKEHFVVHDAGGAVGELAGAGGQIQHPSRLLSPLLVPMGLSVSEDGAIFGQAAPGASLMAVIVLVGNTSKEAADFLIHRHKPPRRNLNALVEQLLDNEFPKRWDRKTAILGASNKRHRFDYVVHLDDQRQLLMDVVSPEASSINSAIVSHLDVRNAGSKKFEHRIVYDDAAEWKSADLALVRVGARPVPFSHLSEALERLAA